MTNPRTIDRRDVAHQTNPIGDHEAIQETMAGVTVPENSHPGGADQKQAAGRGTVNIKNPDKLAR